MKATGSKRERGAYYTPEWLAQALADWAVRAPSDIVVDPAAGSGDLLLAAAKRLTILGGSASRQVFGIELHKQTVRALQDRLASIVSTRQLLQGDFFLLAPKLPKCDVVLANPPYVRHHVIPARSAEAMRASLNGQAHLVEGRASAWAYFLVRAPALLRPHGRLAFVLPAEILMSDYAERIVENLTEHFASVKLIHCNRRVFGNLGQQTIICLAENYRAARRHKAVVGWASLDVGGAITEGTVPQLRRVTCRNRSAGAKLTRLRAPLEALELEKELQARANVRRLGDLASIGIGYVTGNNRFFHLTEGERKELGLHARHLIRVVTRSRRIVGLDFTVEDWSALRARGDPCWLLAPKGTRDKGVQKVLRRGRRENIHTAFKCQVRPSWWEVPVKLPPPAIMIYMGSHPGIRVNSASVRVPNSLYDIRELSGITAQGLAVGSMTSVFQLSALLNARTLGGGLRKLEPSDAESILVPVVSLPSDIEAEIDKLARNGDRAQARMFADKVVLRESLGWPANFVRRISNALDSLED